MAARRKAGPTTPITAADTIRLSGKASALLSESRDAPSGLIFPRPETSI